MNLVECCCSHSAWLQNLRSLPDDLRYKYLKKAKQRSDQRSQTYVNFSSVSSYSSISLHPSPPRSADLLPMPPSLPLFPHPNRRDLQKNQFPPPSEERPNVSPVCLIDDAQTPSHTPLLFIAPQSWSLFSAFLWQIITGDVIAIPPGE